MPENSKINPQVRTLTVGVRALRELTIYPLSVGDEIKLSDIITETIRKFFSKADRKKGQTEQAKNIEFTQFLIDMITTNIKRILTLISDIPQTDAETFFDDVTNLQLTEIANAIFEMNFEAPSKNLTGLIKIATQNLSLLIRQQQQSASGIQDTPSETSTQSGSSMEG